MNLDIVTQIIGLFCDLVDPSTGLGRVYLLSVGADHPGKARFAQMVEGLAGLLSL